MRFLIRILSIALVALPAASFARAGLEWEQKEISLAPSVGTKQIEVVYTFTNRSDQPVKVWVAGASCGCVTPALEKEIYGPGESGTIRAVYTPGSQTGHQEKTIRVATDEPDATPTVLLLKVDLPETYKLTPRLLRWKTGEEVQPKTTAVSLPPGVGWSAPELHVPVGFHATLETVKEGERYAIRISPETTDVAKRVSLVVELNGQDLEPVRLPVMLVVQ